MPTTGPFRMILFEATITDTAYLSVKADKNKTSIGILFSDGTYQLLVYADHVNLMGENHRNFN
jgi:hypothetical protein